MQKKKFLTYMLIATTAITALPMGVLADTNSGNTQGIEGSSLVDGKTSANVPVQYTVDATFTVRLPSSIELSNTDGSWGYTGQVGVKGDIDAGKSVKVKPDSYITMYDVTNRPTDNVPAGAEDQAYDHKDAKDATVVQAKTQWTMTELSADTYSDTALTLNAGTTQSGKWKGKLNVNISYGEYVEEPGLYGSDGSFTPWSTLVNDGKITVTDNVIQTRHDTSMEGRLVIADGITRLEDQAFAACSNLKNINIPESVTSIGYGAFALCSNLTNINIPESVTSIGKDAFNGCTGLTSITIPDSVTSIGDHAFYECSSLTSITVPGSVTSIEENTFSKCKSLTSVDISNGVTCIKFEAFSDCSNLTRISIPESVTSIGVHAFYECSSLTSITIPGSVTSIEDNTFHNCKSLTSVDISNGVTCIRLEAFYGCSNLTHISIPEGVTSILGGAFNGCSNLTHITIPSSITNIDGGVFYGCSNLADITFAGTQEQWSAITKKFSWNNGIPATVVHCTDGDVRID